MGGQLSIDAVIQDMRMSRNFMVQTEIQYIFIYRAVLDALAELLSLESEKVNARTFRATTPPLVPCNHTVFGFHGSTSAVLTVHRVLAAYP